MGRKEGGEKGVTNDLVFPFYNFGKFSDRFSIYLQFFQETDIKIQWDANFLPKMVLQTEFFSKILFLSQLIFRLYEFSSFSVFVSPF